MSRFLTTLILPPRITTLSSRCFFFADSADKFVLSLYNDTISPRLCKLTEDDELDSEVPVITTTHHYHPFNFLHQEDPISQNELS